MSKATSLRELSDEKLQIELTQAQKELFDVRFQSASERNDTPSNLKKLRRNIARLKTIQRQREIAAVSQ